MYDRYCYCITCKRVIHSMGIARHRSAHKKRGEDCVIRYSNGDTYEHHFSKRVKGGETDGEEKTVR